MLYLLLLQLTVAKKVLDLYKFYLSSIYTFVPSSRTGSLNSNLNLYQLLILIYINSFPSTSLTLMVPLSQLSHFLFSYTANFWFLFSFLLTYSIAQPSYFSTASVCLSPSYISSLTFILLSFSFHILLIIFPFLFSSFHNLLFLFSIFVPSSTNHLFISVQFST